MKAFIKQNYKKALDQQDIQAFYQPVIRTTTGQLCGFEALARWIDPELGVIYPNEFIPVLEREGLIHLLDTAILRQVCARMRSIVAKGEIPVPVSVNLSRLDFILCDIFALTDQIVSEYRIPHDYICFEITESVMAEHKDIMLGIVDRFRSAGYQIWMDDFGSAYSSLNVLNEFSFDELKLDMSFIKTLNMRSMRIMASIVKMAKIIGLHTLAEGVETKEQFAYLRDIGCEKVQGYYFGKPLPYEEALLHLKEQGIHIEAPQDRHYYDQIGKIDYFSAVPFMTRKEYNRVNTVRELSSIPLALTEFTPDSFKVLFYNSAFEETAHNAGMFTRIFTQEMQTQPQPYHMLTHNILNLIDSVKVNGDGKMLFTINDQYYEIRARRMAQGKDKFCVLISINNLSKNTQMERTGYLDDSIRQIYALYERITLLNYPEDSIKPLYTDTREDLVESRQGIKAIIDEYAQRYIYPEDKARFIKSFDPETTRTHLKESGRVSFSDIFRTNVRHGQYAWKEYTVLTLDEQNYLLLVRNIHDNVKNLAANNLIKIHEAGPYAPEQLWTNLLHSDVIRLFWKDRDRRFLGVNQGFLDFYDFRSAEEVIGKNDEEMGWHVHPDLYMNDEYKVIHEGLTFRNVHGKCMSHGENKDIFASKTPLYDENGEITGLLGCFFDIDSLTVNDQQVYENARRDLLTGLLNSRGISEEAEAFHDEYYLRGTDFIRIHIEINDFESINAQYGFDFGDKVLTAFGQALKKEFGVRSSVGRYAGQRFTVLTQVENQKEVPRLRRKVETIGRSVRKVDGKPVTLYLSVGYALYSELLNMEMMTKIADDRLLADYEEHKI